MPEPINLQNKSALVTGASGTIGAATVQLFARHNGFCWIHYNSNKEQAVILLEAIRRQDGDGRLIQADLKVKSDLAGMVETISRHGGVDILVNNSGIIRDSLLIDMKDEDVTEVTDINLLAPFTLTRELGKTMMDNGSGKIINISSIASLHGRAGQANYAASKAGLEALTRIAAVELGPFGIQVNAVAPGITESNMTAAMMDTFNRQFKRKIPLRKFGTPEDIAGVILFLASPMADYITGQTITVDGGLTLS